MPAYHSQFTDDKLGRGTKTLGNVPVLPLKSTSKYGKGSRGPAPLPLKSDEPDVVDEALDLFKANIYFTSFEVKEKADRLLIYCTLYTVLCLKKLAVSRDRNQATQDMYAMAVQRFAIPGESGFPLNAFYDKPRSAAEEEELRKYLTQIRLEVGSRLLERVFDPKLNNGEENKPSKWWTCFAKKKFLKVELKEGH